MKNKMRHDKDTVLKALAELYNFSDDKQYQNNLTITMQYIEDAVNLMAEYKQMSETAIKTLVNATAQVEAFKKILPQDHKRKGK